MWKQTSGALSLVTCLLVFDWHPEGIPWASDWLKAVADCGSSQRNTSVTPPGLLNVPLGACVNHKEKHFWNIYFVALILRWAIYCTGSPFMPIHHKSEHEKFPDSPWWLPPPCYDGNNWQSFIFNCVCEKHKFLCDLRAKWDYHPFEELTAHSIHKPCFYVFYCM